MKKEATTSSTNSNTADSDSSSSSTSNNNNNITLFAVPPSKSTEEKLGLAQGQTQTTKSQQSQNKPKVVWLMSYPNSGTSYTMSMTARASTKATATNYGREVTNAGEISTPLYDNDDEQPWGGPFWNPNGDRPLPKDYILTKTHCGGRCIPCGPDEYVTDEKEFLRECTRGAGLASLKDKQRHDTSALSNFMDDGYQWVHYDPSIVKKAIHLIRSPFGKFCTVFLFCVEIVNIH
jgi:hypothetical protein